MGWISNLFHYLQNTSDSRDEDAPIKPGGLTRDPIVFADTVGEPQLARGFDPSEKILNGRHAEALLTDPLLCAVFEAVAQRYRLAWENSPRGDIEAQRVAHMSLAAIKDVQGALRSHLGNAKLFEADLTEKARRDAARSPY